METPGKEIIPRNFFLEDETRQLIQNTDLTLIFNKHGSANDAERSVALVEPRSVVFLEGIGREATSVSLIDSLNAVWVHYGPNSPEYKLVKQDALDNIAIDANIPARDHSDFHVHKSRQISLLLEKNCYISYADYNAYSLQALSGEAGAAAKAICKNFEKNYNDTSFTPLLEHGLKYGKNFAKAIHNIEMSIHAQNAMHHTREFMATIDYIEHIHRIDHSPHKHELAHTNTGKLKTYAIYGTAHNTSLSEAFKTRGIQPEVHVIDLIHETDHIPANNDEYGQDFRRKVALNAFASLARYAGAQNEGVRQAVDALHKPFEQLNHNKEDYQRIMCELLAILAIDKQDPERAFQQLNNTYARIIDNNL